MTKTEYIENIVKKLKTRKSKNIIYTAIIISVVSIFGYRFYSVANENNFQVFNMARFNATNGTPVRVLKMQKTDGVLYEPITIKNNRAYVSGKRVNMFYAGQKVGDCKVISVSKNIDLDTGMHVIKTSNCADGLHYAENKKNGFYIPVSAIHGNVVYVAEQGVARAVKIDIENQDMQNALVKSGIKSSDIVILSDVQNNQKIKIAE